MSSSNYSAASKANVCYTSPLDFSAASILTPSFFLDFLLGKIVNSGGNLYLYIILIIYSYSPQWRLWWRLIWALAIKRGLLLSLRILPYRKTVSSAHLTCKQPYCIQNIAYYMATYHFRFLGHYVCNILLLLERVFNWLRSVLKGNGRNFTDKKGNTIFFI